MLGSTGSSPLVNRRGMYNTTRNSSSTPSTPTASSIHTSRTAVDNVLRYSSLPRLSSVLNTNELRADSGFPSSLAVSTKFIAIGTTRGLLLIFDYHQRLLHVLGHVNQVASLGPVVCMALDKDSQWLASAHRDGHILLWEPATKKLMRTIEPTSTNSSVLSVDFIAPSDAGNTANNVSSSNVGTCPSLVSVDRHGAVHLHSFRRIVMLNSVESRCLINENENWRHNVLAVVSLQPGSTPHSTYNMGLYVLLTRESVMVMSARPRSEVLFKMNRFDKDDDTTNMNILEKDTFLPCAAWRCAVPAEGGVNGVLDPALAVAWGRQLLVLSLTCTNHDMGNGILELQVSFREIAREPLRSSVTCGISWIGARTLLLLDEAECVHAVDAFELSNVDKVELSPALQLVHTSSLLRFNVSPKQQQQVYIRQEKEYASFSSSFRSIKGQVLVLGHTGLHVFTLLSWYDRVTALVCAGQYVEAMALCFSFYDGSARAVSGLPAMDISLLQQRVSDQLVSLVLAYMDLSISTPPAIASERRSRLCCVGNTCVKYLVAVDRADVLFSSVYEWFCELDDYAAGIVDNCELGSTSSTPVHSGVVTEIEFSGGQRLFLELLEPFILANRLSLMAPIIVRDFLYHFRTKQWLERAEQCLIRLDPITFDTNAVVRLCANQRLFMGLIHVYSRGLMDYVTPLDILLDVIRNIAVETGSMPKLSKNRKGKARSRSPEELSSLYSEQKKVSHILLVYLSHCLTGRAFLSGTIPLNMARRVKSEVYTWLLLRHRAVSSSEGIHEYPHLHMIIDMNPGAFFRTIYVALRDDAIVDDRASQMPLRNTDVFSADGQESPACQLPVPDRQLIIDILIGIIFGNDIAVTVHRANNLNDKKRIGITAFSSANIMTAAVSAGFHDPNCVVEHFCLFLARTLAHHGSATNGSVAHVVISNVALEWCINIVAGAASLGSEREQVIVDLYRCGLLGIFDTDALLTLAETASLFRVCELIYRTLNMHSKVLSCYLRDPYQLSEVFSFVTNVFANKTISSCMRNEMATMLLSHWHELAANNTRAAAALTLTNLSTDVNRSVELLVRSPSLQFSYLGELLSLVTASHGDGKPTDKLMKLPPHLHELYIDLMCRFEPTKVYDYLRSHRDDFRVENTLEICRRHLVTDATAWMMERSGDISGALSLVLEVLSECVNAIIDVASTDSNLYALTSKVDGLFGFALSICSRNSDILDVEDRHMIWFSVLDAAVSPQRQVKVLIEKQSTAGLIMLSELIKGHVDAVVNTMASHVPLPVILYRVLSDSHNEHGTFGEVKDIVTGMVESYTYERTLLSTLNNMLSTDLAQTGHYLTRMRRRAIADNNIRVAIGGVGSIPNGMCYLENKRFHSCTLDSKHGESYDSENCLFGDSISLHDAQKSDDIVATASNEVKIAALTKFTNRELSRSRLHISDDQDTPLRTRSLLSNRENGTGDPHVLQLRPSRRTINEQQNANVDHKQKEQKQEVHDVNTEPGPLHSSNPFFEHMK